MEKLTDFVFVICEKGKFKVAHSVFAAPNLGYQVMTDDLTFNQAEEIGERLSEKWDCPIIRFSRL